MRPLDCQSKTTWSPISHHLTLIIELPMWHHLTVDPLPLEDQSIATWSVFIRLPMLHHLTVDPIPLEDQSIATWLLSQDFQCDTTWLSIPYHLKTNPLPLDFHHKTAKWRSIPNHLTVNPKPLECQSSTTSLPIRCHLTSNVTPLDHLKSNLSPLSFHHKTVNVTPLDCQSHTTWRPIHCHLNCLF